MSRECDIFGTVLDEAVNVDDTTYVYLENRHKSDVFTTSSMTFKEKIKIFFKKYETHIMSFILGFYIAWIVAFIVMLIW